MIFKTAFIIRHWQAKRGTYSLAPSDAASSERQQLTGALCSGSFRDDEDEERMSFTRPIYHESDTVLRRQQRWIAIL